MRVQPLLQVEEVAIDWDAAAISDVVSCAVVQSNDVLTSGLDPSVRVRACGPPQVDSGLLHAVKVNVSAVVGPATPREKVHHVFSGVGEGEDVVQNEVEHFGQVLEALV